MTQGPPDNTCSVPDCIKPVFVAASGLCSMHYSRLKRHGDVNTLLRQSPQVDGTEKRCPRCAVVKPMSDFGIRTNGKPQGYCKSCMIGYDSGYSSSPSGREARRKARATWNSNNHEYFLQYRYGIGRADYDRMLTAQDGKCAICRCDEPNSRNNVWSVDHCHTTNKVRGLLCMSCNIGLGYFKDDAVRLQAAVDYLKAQ